MNKYQAKISRLGAEWLVGDGIIMFEFKAGDTVRLNELGMSKQGLGNPEYKSTPCTKRLLDGEVLEVAGVVPVVPGSPHFSVHFFGAKYSLSENYLEKAKN